MKMETHEEILIELKSSKWIVPKPHETFTSMTLYPHISWENIDLTLVDKLPKSKVFSFG